MAAAEMAMYASEQSSGTTDFSLATTEPAATEHSENSSMARNLYIMAQMTCQMECEIHVDFNNGMWWAMPHFLSDPILEEWRNGAHQVSFIWDWKNQRRGSYVTPDGEYTSINRYVIDFDTMYQRNTDSGSTRRVKVVCLLPSPH